MSWLNGSRPLEAPTDEEFAVLHEARQQAMEAGLHFAYDLVACYETAPGTGSATVFGMKTMRGPVGLLLRPKVAA